MSLRGIDRGFGALACLSLAVGLGLWVYSGRGAVGAAVRDAQTNLDTPQSSKTPILVELFTSEGCSSCPPADALVGQLDRQQPVPNAEIIVLSEHVDYWNHDGWQDRFSSSDLTARQKDYQYLFRLDDVYTPQMVVNGVSQMSGTDVRSIQAALEKAAASHPIPLQITSVQVRGKYVTFTLHDGMPDMPGDVNVYAALVDPSDTTEVHAGENGGRTLQHVAVVRKLVRIGSSLRTQDLGKKPLGFNGDVSGKPGVDGMRLVVFVQTKHIGPVEGADACLITSAKTNNGPVNPCPLAPS